MQLWFPSVLHQTPPDTTKYPSNSHCQGPAAQVEVKKHSDWNQTKEACPLELVHQYIHIYIHSNSLCAETVFFFFCPLVWQALFSTEAKAETAEGPAAEAFQVQLWLPSVLHQTPTRYNQVPIQLALPGSCSPSSSQTALRREPNREGMPVGACHQHLYVYIAIVCVLKQFSFFLSTSLASSILYRGEGGTSRRSSCRGIPSAAMASIGFAPNPTR